MPDVTELPPLRRSDAPSRGATGLIGPPQASRRDIRLFVAYRLVSRGYFHLSILLVFLLQSGHSFIQVSLVLGAYGLGLAAMSPLTPRFTRRLGAGPSLALGELLKGAGLTALAFGATSVWLALAAQIVNATGFALSASADAGVAFTLGPPAVVKQLQARAQSLMFLALLISGVAGGALYLVDHRAPLLAGAASAAIAAVLAGALARGRRQVAGLGAATAAAEDGRLSAVELRWVSYYVFTRGVMLGSFVGLLPYLIFVRLHTGALTLAIYLAAYSLAAFVTARWSSRLTAALGVKRLAAASGGVLVAALVTFAFSTTIVPVACALILLGAASGCVRPATLTELGVLSAASRSKPPPPWVIARMEGAFGVFNALVVIAGGAAVSLWSFRWSMVGMCFAYLLAQLAVGSWLRSRPQPTVVHAGQAVAT